jgi:hypothetical protein
VSGLQPSYGIRNDPLPVALHSGPAGDRQKSFQPMTAVTMAQVEHKPEAVPGSPPVEAHNKVNNNRVHNKVHSNMVHNKALELLHLLLLPKAPTTNPNGHLLRHWTMGLRER